MKFFNILLFFTLFSPVVHAEVDISIINNTVIVEIDGQKAYIPIDKNDLNRYDSDEIVKKACKVLKCKYVNK